MLVAHLSELDVATDTRTVWTQVRDKVIVGHFGGRVGWGDGTQPDEYRFRLDTDGNR